MDDTVTCLKVLDDKFGQVNILRVGETLHVRRFALGTQRPDVSSVRCFDQVLTGDTTHVTCHDSFVADGMEQQEVRQHVHVIQRTIQGDADTFLELFERTVRRGEDCPFPSRKNGT